MKGLLHNLFQIFRAPQRVKYRPKLFHMATNSIHRNGNAAIQLQLPKLLQQSMSQRALQAHSHIRAVALEIFLELEVCLFGCFVQIGQEIDIFVQTLLCRISAQT